MIANYPYFGLPNYMKYMNMGVPYKQPSHTFSNTYNKKSSFKSQQNINYQNPNYSSYSYKNYNISKNNNFIDRQPKNLYKELNSDINTIKQETYSMPIFNLFGIDIYFDDILIICLLFFLYNEGVTDYYLFLILILLLMS